MSKYTGRYGKHRPQFEKNRAIIYKTQTVCGICGQPVDKTLKWPHPMSKTVDHIIPVSRGGHPSDIDNMQLAHMICNRLKSNKVQKKNENVAVEMVSNDVLPLTIDWMSYHS